jgi:lysophospholipase L1-like esterase
MSLAVTRVKLRSASVSRRVVGYSPAMRPSFCSSRRCAAVLLLLSLAVPCATRARAAAGATEAPERFTIPASDEGIPGAGPIWRAAGFQRLWRERRSAWAESAKRDHGAVVFLGDSITQFWNEGLDAAFPGLKVANRGISGDTTRGVLFRLDDVLALDPAAVVLLIGTNDLSADTAPEIVAGNLKLILAALKRHNPRMPIVVNQVFPSSATHKRSAEQIKALNALYLAAVKNDPQITYLETWSLFAGPDGDATPALFPDLLHPNGDGYAKWAAALRPILATLGLLETSADAFKPEEGFESLFNGRDLSGWGYRPTSEADQAGAKRWQASDPNAAAWPFVTEASNFDGLTATPDGRYAAIAGRLVVKTPPEYRKIQQLWTKREFPQDFVLKLEFRATPNADSGVYLRAPQLQCRDYLIAGPYKALKNYKPQDWNEIVVTVKDGVAHATCNGEVLEDALKLPASGPIGLEGDRGQMEYRRIRIKTLSR